MITTIAIAEFTEDMAETLQTYFSAYQQEGIVRVEVTDHGLWLVNPHSGTRQFLGSARRLQRNVLPGPGVPRRFALIDKAS